MVEVLLIDDEADAPVEAPQKEERIGEGDMIGNQQSASLVGEVLSPDHMEPVERVRQQDENDPEEG